MGSFSDYGEILTASTFTLDVTGLTVPDFYRFRVIVTNAVGISSSNLVSSIVANVPDAPT